MNSLNKKRAVFYSRVSTADQVEGTSLETQKALCLAEISKLDMEFVDEYSDRGQSGADNSRPEWQALLADARLGKFDAVFVFDLDRFSRDTVHGLTAARELRDLEIALHDAKDPTADVASDNASFMTTIRLAVAQEERRKIKQRTVLGQRAKLEAGEWPGGKPSFGWRLEGIRTRHPMPVPDDVERETLTKVVGWLLRDGKSIGEICELLNSSGIKSRTGIRWGHAVLRKVLSNPALYRGWFVWGSPNHGSMDARSHKTKVDRRGNPIYGTPKKVELPDPPLTEHEFEAIQNRLKAHPRAQAPQQPSISRPLSGRIFGRCGKHYTGTTIAGKDYDVYRCTGNRFRGNENKSDKCGCPQIHAQKIEARVWGEVAGLICDSGRLQSLASQWLKHERVIGSESQSEIADLGKQEGKLRQALERVHEDYYLADATEQLQLKKLVSKYRDQLAVIESRRLLLDSYRKDADLQQRQLVSLEQLASRAKDRIHNLSNEETKEIYSLLRLKIVISDIENSEPNSMTILGQIDDRIGMATTLGVSHSNEYPDLPFALNEIQ